MRKIITTLILFHLLLSGCKENCGTKAVEMQLKPLTTDWNFEKSTFNGYYHSEFQSGRLTLGVGFVHQGAGNYCDYYWISYPVDNGLIISCRETIILNNDTIQPNTPLNNYINIENLETDRELKYLVTLKNGVSVPANGHYTFAGKLKLNDGVELSDSCLVKFN